MRLEALVRVETTISGVRGRVLGCLLCVILYKNMLLLFMGECILFSSQKYIRTLLFYLTLVFLRYHTVSQRGVIFMVSVLDLGSFYCDVGLRMFETDL